MSLKLRDSELFAVKSQQVLGDFSPIEHKVVGLFSNQIVEVLDGTRKTFLIIALEPHKTVLEVTRGAKALSILILPYQVKLH